MTQKNHVTQKIFKINKTTILYFIIFSIKSSITFVLNNTKGKKKVNE